MAAEKSQRGNQLFRSATLAKAHIDLFLSFGQPRDLERAAEVIEAALQDYSREESGK